MFRRLPDADRAALTIHVDGRELAAKACDSVAAALIAHGIVVARRTPVSGAPRGPYCMMGVCFECLVTIDGAPNRQACMVEVSEGMRVETGSGKRDVGE